MEILLTRTLAKKHQFSQEFVFNKVIVLKTHAQWQLVDKISRGAAPEYFFLDLFKAWLKFFVK